MKEARTMTSSAGLMIGAGRMLDLAVEPQQPPNKALQQTLDPVVPFAAAKRPSASRAAELWR